jgi:hypothetical protein
MLNDAMIAITCIRVGDLFVRCHLKYSSATTKNAQIAYAIVRRISRRVHVVKRVCMMDARSSRVVHASNYVIVVICIIAKST